MGKVLEPQVTPLVKTNDIDKLNDIVMSIRSETNTRITIIDPNGVVLIDSEEDPKTLENHSDRPEIIKAKKGDIGTSLRLSDTVKEEMLYVALPLEENGSIIGFLRLSFFIRDINVLIGTLQERVLYIVIVITVLALFGSLIVARSISRPIREIGNAAKMVAEGDFTKRVFLDRNDEIKVLSDRFNFMTERIQSLFDELSRQKEELVSIISSMKEGLLVLDDQGKIVLTNDSFMDISASDASPGRYFWEVIREPELGEIIKKVRDNKKGIYQELNISNRAFSCSATYIESKKETVLTFHDITEMKDLEKIKREFVSNVSHELRTPLAVIKGFLETLGGESDEEKVRYLEKIQSNTERLITIVKDISLLSELEEKGALLQLETVKFGELVKNAVKIFEKELEKKGLTLDLNMRNGSTAIFADPFKLEQMIINLVDNAIKYTENGGITIGVDSDNDSLLFTVSDTGIGIPQEDLPRIFERFYRVDKSRSRSLGGTGLGLAIVKYIVLLHNGKISVESARGGGTTFTVTIPKNRENRI
jgi:two-component system phosphate regulon sensor histidine kinase PhoR